jgi:uncharacterized protein
MKGLESVVVAYSGGLDSTFLLKAAVDALGRENVVAVTARSETYPASEYAEARRYAKRIGSRHVTIKTTELDIEAFRRNPVDRCYHCKRELFLKLESLRRSKGFAHVVDGTNADDLRDVRYGRLAAREFGVRSPLLDAGMTKSDIRALSRRLGLETWSKSSFACLASRIPFDTRITEAALRRVEAAERFIRGLGISQVRVRAHGETARIEVGEGEMSLALRARGDIVKRLKALGFVYVSLDLAGYRTGSMHEAAAGRSTINIDKQKS